VIVSDAGKPFAIDELDNYATRKHPKVLAWLARHPRWTFHFTPTSAAWLNAVENFFSKMTRQRIRRGVFRSIADLQAAINAYLATSSGSSSGFRLKSGHAVDRG
jgi:transposase